MRNEPDPEMADEYDFSDGVRGNLSCLRTNVGRFAKGSNVVVLDPDVARVFTDSESVNQALGALFPEPISELSAKANSEAHKYRTGSRSDQV